MKPKIENVAQLLDHDRNKELSSLTPLSDTVVRNIARRYPGISSQYLEFIRTIGTGQTTRGFYIYDPEPASDVEQYTSFRIYNSEAKRNAFTQRLPADAIMIADPGASWRYCLCPSMGQAVFCLDMGPPLFETTAEDFFSFVASNVIAGVAEE